MSELARKIAIVMSSLERPGTVGGIAALRAIYPRLTRDESAAKRS